MHSRNLIGRLVALEAVRRSTVCVWAFLPWDADLSEEAMHGEQPVFLPSKAPSPEAWAASVHQRHPEWFRRPETADG
jgi:hypothetical protein